MGVQQRIFDLQRYVMNFILEWQNISVPFTKKSISYYIIVISGKIEYAISKKSTFYNIVYECRMDVLPRVASILHAEYWEGDTQWHVVRSANLQSHVQRLLWIKSLTLHIFIPELQMKLQGNLVSRWKNKEFNSE